MILMGKKWGIEDMRVMKIEEKKKINRGWIARTRVFFMVCQLFLVSIRVFIERNKVANSDSKHIKSKMDS